MNTKLISLAQAYARAFAYSQSPSKAEIYRLLLKKLSDYLPSGSGFDCGTVFDADKSTANKLIFRAEFHHMSAMGYYVGWSQNTFTVTPCFEGFDLRLTVRYRPRCVDAYLHREAMLDTFSYVLEQEIDYGVWP